MKFKQLALFALLIALSVSAFAQMPGPLSGKNFFPSVAPNYTWLQTVPSSSDGAWSEALTPHATGNVLVVCAAMGTGAVPTISNSPSSNTWTIIPTTGYYVGTSAATGLACWKTVTTSTSAQTITVGGSNLGFHGFSVASEYSGIAGTPDVDGKNSAGTNTTPTVTLSPTAAGNLTFCYLQNTGTTQTIGGFATRSTDAFDVQYFDGASISGSQTVAGSGGSNPWSMICGVIK